MLIFHKRLIKCIFVIVCPVMLTLFSCNNLVNLESENDTTLTDIDGNVYNKITIGNQIWTSENLRTTRYNDGTSIEKLSGDKYYFEYSPKGTYCFYNDTKDTDLIKKFGALYNYLQ